MYFKALPPLTNFYSTTLSTITTSITHYSKSIAQDPQCQSKLKILLCGQFMALSGIIWASHGCCSGITWVSPGFKTFSVLLYSSRKWMWGVCCLMKQNCYFQRAWQNVDMQPHPWAPTALIPHFRAFKRGILLCCISRGSKVTSRQSWNVYILHHFP